MGKRALIISASAGTGHTRAAEALAKVFAQDTRIAEVQHLDALDYTNKLFRDFYSKLYLQLVRNAPMVLDWMYRTSDEPWKTDALRIRLDRLNTGPLARFIRSYRPHITVCTHFMPAGIISHLIAREQLEARLSVVVTDFDMHAMWLTRMFHRYFVAIEETKAHLEALGLPSERISVSGIPIDPLFSVRYDRAGLRRAYGLEPDMRTLLVSAGAMGVGPAEAIVSRLLQLRHKVQTVVVCGKSEELRSSIVAALKGRPGFHVFGYSERMHELMQMADLFIGKPGGLTTAEALASGLPMVITAPIPGQEERNSDHLLEDGVAVRCNELTTLSFKIDRLLGQPGRLEEMRLKALAMGRPDAAERIVHTLIEDKLPVLALSAQEREAIAQAAVARKEKRRKLRFS